MFLRPASLRAVQRTRPFSDLIWISEDLLHDAYQRFYLLSKVRKRHGSFVPGPLECRRRFGRRRMAHSLDHPVSSPTQGISALWNWLFGEIDNSNWKWEAPKSLAGQNTACTLSRAVHDSDIYAPRIGNWSDLIEPLRASSENDSWFVLDEVEKLCRMIETSSEGEVWENCCKVSRSFKQNLVLGLIPESKIRVALRKFTKALKSGILPPESSGRMSLLLFEAIWEGMTNCSVLPLEEVSGRFLKDFLWDLHQVPPSLQWQNLIGRVLRSVTADQLYSMRAPICIVVHRWRESWTGEAISTALSQVSESSVLIAQGAESDSASRVYHASQLCKHATEDPTNVDILAEARQALRGAHFSISTSLITVTNAENAIVTHRGSVIALADVLSLLPVPLLHHVLWHCTTKLCIGILPSGDHWKKHYWLSLIAQLPGVDNKLFVELWGEMDTRAESLEPYLCVEPVLSQWASQGHSPNHLLVRNTLEIIRSGHLDFGTLLYAIHKHNEQAWTKTLSLFSLLDALKKYKLVPQILHRMRQLGMGVPKYILRSSIETMVRYDTRKALQLSLLGRIPLWTCPKLTIAMVRNPLVPSNHIWRRLQVPRRRLKLQVVVKSPMWWDVKSLLIRMIIEFAYSERRSQKVVFRNVYRYIRYLQLHKMSLTPDVSRALTHAGLTRRMMLGKFIREQTLRYVLGIVKDTEGPAVAVELEKAIREWNRRIITQQDWHYKQQQLIRREMNVLRVGPID